MRAETMKHLLIQRQRLNDDLADRRAWINVLMRDMQVPDEYAHMRAVKQPFGELAALLAKAEAALKRTAWQIDSVEAEIEQLRGIQLDTALMSHELAKHPIGNWEQLNLFK